MPTLQLAIDSRQALTGAIQFRQATETATAGAKKATQATDRLQDSFTRITRLQRSLSRALSSVGAAFGAYLGARDFVSTTTDLDRLLLTIKGVTGASEQEFGHLQDIITEVGETTRYSSRQAAEALLELGRAGLTMGESARILPRILTLSTAGLISLRSAADITINTMYQFGLSAQDAERAVDALVTVSNKTNIDVYNLAESLKYTGSIASDVGVSIEEASAAIGVLGNRGLKGSLAGTKLRAVILGLIAPTARARRTLAEMGLTLDEVNPETVGLGVAMTRLRDAGLSATQAYNIFNRLNASAALVLSAEAGEMKKLTKDTEEQTGAAQDLADTINLSLEASFKSLRATVEAAYTSLGKSFANDLLRGTVETVRGAIQIIFGLGDAASQASVKARILAETLRWLAISGAVYLAAKLILAIDSMVRFIATMQTLTITISPITGTFLALAAAAGLFVGIAPYFSSTNDRVVELSESAKSLADEMSRIKDARLDFESGVELESPARQIRALTDQIRVLEEVLTRLKAGPKLLNADSLRIKELRALTEGTASQIGIPTDEITKLATYGSQGNQVSFDLKVKGEDVLVQTNDVIEKITLGIQELQDQILRLTQIQNTRPKIMTEEELRALIEAKAKYSDFIEELEFERQMVGRANDERQAEIEIRKGLEMAQEAGITNLEAERRVIESNVYELLELNRAHEQEIEEKKALEEAEKRAASARDQATDAIRDQIQSLRDERSLLLYSTEQREIERRVMEAQEAARRGGIQLTNSEIESIRQLAGHIQTLSQREKEYEEKLQARKSAQQQAARETESAVDRARDLWNGLELETRLLEENNRERRIQLALYEWEKNAAKDLTGVTASLSASYEQRIRQFEQLSRLRKVADDIGQTFSDSFTQGLIEATEGMKAFSDNVEALMHDITRVIIQEFITQPLGELIASNIYKGLVSAFSGFFGTGLGGSAGATPAATGAHGLVMGGGQIQPMSHGGLIGSPTYIPMSGARTALVGERGLEMVAPVQRGRNGDLGIRAEGLRPITISQTFYGPADAKEMRRSARQTGTDIQRRLSS